MNSFASKLLNKSINGEPSALGGSGIVWQFVKKHARLNDLAFHPGPNLH